MAKLPRTYAKLTRRDLRKLREIAIEEHDAFLGRNPHINKAYRNSLVAICPCQGAASHYINPKVGVKDFDIWHFYFDSSKVPFPYRAHKRIEKGYKGKPVDFLKRAISRSLRSSTQRSDILIKSYLLQRNSSTKVKLSKKAVIGLFPNQIFGKVIWRGEVAGV